MDRILSAKPEERNPHTPLFRIITFTPGSKFGSLKALLTGFQKLYSHILSNMEEFGQKKTCQEWLVDSNHEVVCV